MKCAFSLVSSPKAKIEKKSRRQVGERNEGWSVDEWIAHLAPPSVGRGIVTAGGRGQVASVTRARRSKRKYRYGSGMEASRFIVRFVLHRRRIWLILLNRFITYLRIRKFLYIQEVEFFKEKRKFNFENSSFSNNIRLKRVYCLCCPPDQGHDAALTLPSLPPLLSPVKMTVHSSSVYKISYTVVPRAGWILLSFGARMPAECFSVGVDDIGLDVDQWPNANSYVRDKRSSQSFLPLSWW